MTVSKYSSAKYDFNYEEVRIACEQGIIDFSTSIDKAPICIVGDDWFYFAGNEGEGMLWQEYRDTVGIRTMLEEVLDVLNDPISHGLDAEEGTYLRKYIRKGLARYAKNTEKQWARHEALLQRERERREFWQQF